MRKLIVLLLVVLIGTLSSVPRIDASFIPSYEPDKDMATIQKVLEQKLVKERLNVLGYTDQEINSRLNQLSEEELHQFATQLNSLTSGGEITHSQIEILLTILLIIFLICVVFYPWLVFDVTL